MQNNAATALNDYATEDSSKPGSSHQNLNTKYNKSKTRRVASMQTPNGNRIHSDSEGDRDILKSAPMDPAILEEQS